MAALQKACQLLFVQVVSLPIPTSCLRLESPSFCHAQPSLFRDTTAVRDHNGGSSTGLICGGGPYQPLQCPACKMHGDHAPRLFVPSRGDGLGERSISIIWYMAFAASYGFNFGGVLTYKEHCPMSHGVDTLAAMSSLFGQDAGTLFLSAPPPMDFDFTSRGQLRESASLLRTCSDANVAVRTSKFNKVGQDVASGWASPPPTSRDFIPALRQGAQFLRRAVRYRPGELAVALHVRRDDLAADEARRYTPDEWYYKLVEKMGEAYAVKMDVHVFSSTGSRYSAADFDGFRARGMAVHLDEDVLDDWAHMARADVLVMARSSFSLVPALLSQQCVLDMTHWTMAWGWKKELHFVRVNASLTYLDSPQFASDLTLCKQSVARLGNITLRNGTKS